MDRKQHGRNKKRSFLSTIKFQIGKRPSGNKERSVFVAFLQNISVIE